MAPRRAAEAVSEEPEEDLVSLTFNEPLSWRAGKPIATGELLKRLDTLANELRDMGELAIDKDSFGKVAKELAGQNLLGHKDKGVRAYVACCLVDILKLCAPSAPFTPSQTKDIFTFFITSILPALSDPSHAYNAQHKYVLESLVEVKSIVLLCDIPNSEALILHLFSSFFDMISGSTKASTGESIAKNVEYHMTQMMVTLVDEAQSLPANVVDIIVAQFLRAATPGSGKAQKEVDGKQTTLLPKELPEAYNMAKTICNSCKEKMARYVSQYFNEVILEVSAAAPTKSNGHSKNDGESEDEDAHTGPTESDLQELAKAHRLLRELWRAAPAVLQNVIPQLEAELSADNVQLRTLATETLGDIISGIGAAGPPPPPAMDPAAYPPMKLEDCPQSPISDSILTTPISAQSFAQAHPAVYHSFMGRKNDKSSVIRSGWTTAVGRILTTSAGGIGLSRDEELALVQGLCEKLNDSDEKVRLAGVRAVSRFSFYDIISKLAPNGSVNKSGSVLCSLADRARDRKPAVRTEAMTVLARIWGVAGGEIAADNEAVKEALGGIPTKIFDSFYVNDLEVNVLLDHVMFEQLIPLSYPPAKKAKAANGDSQTQTNGDAPYDPDKIRTERILLLVKSLDQKAKKAFYAMQSRRTTYSQVVHAFLQRCEEFNGGVIEGDAKAVKNKLDSTINWLANLLPDPMRTTQELHKYAKLHDRRSYQLLRFAIAPETEFGIVYKAIKEFQKRINAAPNAPAGLLDTLTPIIYRSASLIYNRSHQPVILNYGRTDENGLAATARSVMKEISDKHPEIFKASVKELCKSLEEQTPTKSRANDAGSVDTLKALASFAKESREDGKSEIDPSPKFAKTLISFALYGTPAKVAKYAVTILHSINPARKEMHMKDLLDNALSGWTFGEDHFVTRLAAISHLHLLDPKLMEDMNDEIIDITTQQILLKTRTSKSEDDPQWQSEEEMDDECQAKCWAIKVLANRLRTTDDPETAKTIAVPVYKLLNRLITKGGELSKQNDTPSHHRSRLRLLAAQQMLKLCKIKTFDELLSPAEFNQLALIAQDSLANVRSGFVEKLQKYIVKGKYPPRFTTIMFLTAFEPSTSFKNSIMTWIRSRVKLCRDTKSTIFEQLFPRLLHLLAHHPDFSTELEELADIGKYIIYYLSTVVSEETLALTYKYAERVKQARDLLAKDEDNIYILSDLAQTLIKKWEEKKGWSMQTYPGKVGIPAGLFGALPSHAVAQEIAEKNYLPEDMDSLLDVLVRKADQKKQKRKSNDHDGRPAKKVKSEPKSRPVKIPAPKKEKVIREKKTPKPKKASTRQFSTPDPSLTDRRKSGRASSAKKNYADRDDSDDDKEMWDGVTKWEYFEKDGLTRVAPPEAASDAEEGEDAEDAMDVDEDAESAVDEPEEERNEEPEEHPGEEPEEQVEEEKTDTPVPEAEEEDSALSAEPVEEPEEEQEKSTPVTNKRSLPSRTSSRRKAAPPASSPAAPTPAKTTKAKVAPKKTLKENVPEVKTAAKATPKSATKSKAKEPIAKGKRATRGKGAKAQDVFDMDESD
ncbi:related to SPO76 protein [Rhynchosporium agropyri]|uniref:Related to SPO76 protein n=1 Tax=Rhynchosporium agropyri TaxID=914238 RepID=A0A1E1KZ51_9HELO|nr:related to SPO76 protein [Rhynchosporium agropyri]